MNLYFQFLPVNLFTLSVILNSQSFRKQISRAGYLLSASRHKCGWLSKKMREMPLTFPLAELLPSDI